MRLYNGYDLPMSQSASSNSRIEYIDIAKGIAILCVMISHFCGGYGHQLLFSFEVPLFFFLSGFFLSSTKAPINTIKKRFRQLMIPFFSLAAVVCIVRLVTAWLHDRLLIDIALDIFIRTFAGSYKTMGAYWFLPALFIASSATSVLLRLNRGFLYCLVLFAIGSYVSIRLSSDMPFSCGLALASVIYVYFGAQCRQLNFLEKPFTSDFFYLTGLGLFWLYGAKRFGVGLSVPLSLNLVLVACSAIILVCRLSKFIMHINFLSAILQFLGRHTLLLLSLHTCDLLFQLPNHISLYDSCGKIGRIMIPILITVLWQWGIGVYTRRRRCSITSES